MGHGGAAVVQPPRAPLSYDGLTPPPVQAVAVVIVPPRREYHKHHKVPSVTRWRIKADKTAQLEPNDVPSQALHGETSPDSQITPTHPYPTNTKSARQHNRCHESQGSEVKGPRDC